VGLSGFLYVAIVVGWAVYLVPFALKRYDEATRNRSIDRFSSAMRVLGRREVEDVEAAAMTRPRPVVGSQTQRAARKAARRRRRTLLVLVLLTGVVTGLAAAGLVSWWSAAGPGALVLLWLMLCRAQARREYGVQPLLAADASGVESALHRDAALPEAQRIGADDVLEQTMARDEVQVDLEAPPAAPADDEPTVVIAPEGADEGEAQVVSGSLWDPVPVTLPTYVHKPRAPRTIRTIDLGSAGVQSSGRKHEESAIYTHHVDPSSVREKDDRDAESQETSQEDKPTRRAVGE
jgi:hypothetical protein